MRILHRDGRYRRFLTRGALVPAKDGAGRHVIGVQFDITERYEKDQRLMLAAAVFDSIKEAEIILDSHGRICEINPAFSELTGYGLEQVKGQRLDELLLSADDSAALMPQLEDISPRDGWHGEVDFPVRGDNTIPAMVQVSAVNSVDGGVSNYIVGINDISELKKAALLLERQASTDQLTGLLNRYECSRSIEEALRRAERRNSQVALLFIDLDRFKQVNDAYGHAAGDELLIAVTERLKSRLRKSDILARIGGDEFIVVVEDVESPINLLRLSQDLIDALTVPFNLDEVLEVRIGASIGVAMFPDNATTSERLISAADMAMYQAKSRGGDCASFFDHQLANSLKYRLDVENRLTEALDQGEFQVYFQPIVDMSSNSVTSLEALLRWPRCDQESDAVQMDSVIEIAEQAGLIGSISSLVLEQTLQHAGDWLAGAPGLNLVVNFAYSDIRQDGFAAGLVTALAQAGVDSSRLVVKVPGKALSIRDKGASANLRALNQAGIAIEIDESWLHQLSLIELARSRVCRARVRISELEELQAGGLVTSFCSLVKSASALGVDIIVVGIEHPEQLGKLKDAGCTCYQGYLFSEPLTAAGVAQLLEI